MEVASPATQDTVVRPVVLDQLGRRGIPDIVEQEHQATVDILELVPVVTLVTAVTLVQVLLATAVTLVQVLLATAATLEYRDTLDIVGRVDPQVQLGHLVTVDTQELPQQVVTLGIVESLVIVATQVHPVTAVTAVTAVTVEYLGIQVTAALAVIVDSPE